MLDGSLATFTGALMAVYSLKLGAIVLGVLLLYLAIRLATLSIARRFATDSLVSEAREQTRFLETIRAMQTIKVSGGGRQSVEWCYSLQVVFLLASGWLKLQ
ncbi:MAG: hypothetical protein WCC64_20725 [Aliidongia sp.]